MLLTPFIPATAEKIFSILATDKTSYDTVAAFGALESEKALGEGAVLFARIDEAKFLADREAEILAAQAAAEEKTDAIAEEGEHAPEIKIDSFFAVELRCAKILSAEKLPKAKKLLKLEVDLGYERRQVVSGIAKYYAPEDLVGKKVVLVANLAPATLCGVESNGMILASGTDPDVRVIFLDDATALGARIS